MEIPLANNTNSSLPAGRLVFENWILKIKQYFIMIIWLGDSWLFPI
jgi:hypothetical protein